ncbi:hypothetical protein R5R35_001377 [Gryllus longicercus]|uniref:PHD-type domain-containing protein n=1 Tax=Gryllus longicercus TaxID=2509291 RepID=A0AAN9Z433_9ORTH
MDVCMKCKSEIKPRNKPQDADYIDCDLCKGKLHPECTTLRASEQRVFARKKTPRELEYYCIKCKSVDIPRDLKSVIFKLNQKIDELQVSNEALVKEVADLKKRNSSESISGGANYEYEDIYAEFIDRQRRSKNIIIYGLHEDQKQNKQQSHENDEKEIKSILSNITDTHIEFSFHRLGILNNMNKEPKTSKANDKVRPIKVLLPDSDLALDILRNKKKYKGNVKISPDMTLRQRSHMRNLISKINEESEKGNKDLHIKYINGVPKIFDSSANEKSLGSKNINPEN